MIQEIQYKGLSRQPSDYLVPDGDLEDVENMVNENGSLVAVGRPWITSTALLAQQGGEGVRGVVYIHKVRPAENVILHERVKTGDDYYDDYRYVSGGISDFDGKGANGIVMGTELFPAGTRVKVYNIASVGNTLILLAADGLHYFLWNEGTGAYNYLGQQPPEINLMFGLECEIVNSDDETATIGGAERVVPKIITEYRESAPDMENYLAGEKFNGAGGDGNNKTETEDKDKWNNAVKSWCNKFIADHATSKGRFMYPFFVRYAYRLYDGTLSYHSAPVLMVPSSGCNPQVFYHANASQQKSETNFFVRGIVAALRLIGSNISDAEAQALYNWREIVRSVDIFISAPLYTYDQAGEVERMYDRDFETELGRNYLIGSLSGVEGQKRQTFAGISKFYDAQMAYTENAEHKRMNVPHFTIAQMEEKIKNCAQFYLLKSIALEDLFNVAEQDGAQNVSLNLSSYTDLEISEDYLPTLVNRERMTDDYDSHDKLIAKYAYNYNSRLHLANLSKVLYSGYDPYSVFAFTNGATLFTGAVVELVVDGKTHRVNHLTAGTPAGELGFEVDSQAMIWYYYPNTAARRVTFYNSGTVVMTMDLKPHPTLNGAYFFDRFNPGRSPGGSFVSATPTGGTVAMGSKVYVSEVDNPFYFPVGNIYTIPDGEVIALASAAKAMSQGQFGEFPLYAFTGNVGVWALSVTEDGRYSARQPVTRDICVSAESVTSVDNAVLFATARGIMLLQGSQSVCLTDVLKPSDSGDFLTFVRGCRMLYDYVHQRIIVYNPDPDYDYSYVYSLESKLWGMISHTKILSGVPSYPEAYCMVVNPTGYSGAAHSLADFTKESAGEITCGFTTRPLKLNMPDVLKTVSAVIQRGVLHRDSVTGVVMSGSRDLVNWHRLCSSGDKYLRGMRGTPFKYFKLKVSLTPRTGDSVSGCSVEYRPRYTRKLR